MWCGKIISHYKTCIINFKKNKMKDYQTKLEAKGLLKNVKRGQFVQHFIDSELYTYKKLSQVTSSTDESFFIGESEIPKSACNLRFEKDDRSSDYIIVTIQFNKEYAI